LPLSEKVRIEVYLPDLLRRAYQDLLDVLEQEFSFTMTITKGFLLIVLSGLAFALGGGLIGYSLAILVPGYYRGVFNGGREPGFDPVGVGVGLGVSQGLLCGLILGGVVVLAVAWYNARRSVFDVRLPSGNDRSSSLHEPPREQTRFLPGTSDRS
jgi:hypothetical protein